MSGESKALLADDVPALELGSPTNKYLVLGVTGSGKTYFVETLQALLRQKGAKTSYVPQYPLFRPTLTVEEFVSYLPVPDEDKAEAMENVDYLGLPRNAFVGGKLLGLLDFPGGVPGGFLGLSGGQRKKFQIIISGILIKANKAPFCVLDEPFAGCDTASMEKVLNVLLKHAGNTAMYIVTHDHIDMLKAREFTVLEVADRVVKNEALSLEQDNKLAVQAFFKYYEKAIPESFDGVGGIKREFLNFEWNFVFLFFKEFDFMPFGSSIQTFAFLQGLATMNFSGDIAYQGMQLSFQRSFILEYAHIGAIIFYCWKHSLQVEAYNVGMSAKKYNIYERIVAQLILNVPCLLFLEVVLRWLANDFWNHGSGPVYTSYIFCTVNGWAYYMLGCIDLNPMIMVAYMTPYIVAWGNLNGILLPRSWIMQGARWTSYLTGVFNFACATKSVQIDKASHYYTFFRKTPDGVLDEGGYAKCDGGIFHWIFMSPLVYMVAITFAIQWYRGKAVPM